MSALTDSTTERALRQEIVHVCRLMYQKDLIAATDGNVSVRWGESHLITTPSGVSKGLIEAEDLVVTDLEGHLVSPTPYRPSAELRTHLEAYRQRPDIRAVVHAHPPITVALTVAGVSLAPCVLPETLVNLGTILTTDYATPTSAQVPLVIRELIRDHDALVLDRHGALTVGRTLMDAYAHMEKIENTAKVIFVARLMGRVQTLPIDEVRRLSAKRAALLGSERTYHGPDCDRCGACEGLSGTAYRPASLTAISCEDLVQTVVAQVLAKLGRL